jgi:ABC-type dipeptide/oligopeptide/nickel transport system permease subunit
MSSSKLTRRELLVYSGVRLSLTVQSVNFVGDALRDALDARSTILR